MVASIPVAKSCLEAYTAGSRTSGIYTIYPSALSFALVVYCDMDTNGGGWTLVWKTDMSNANDHASEAGYNYQGAALTNPTVNAVAIFPTSMIMAIGSTVCCPFMRDSITS